MSKVPGLDAPLGVAVGAAIPADDVAPAAAVEIEPRSAPRGNAWTWWSIAAGAAVSALMRVRFLGTPLTADEGGYLAIARAWGHGRVLYRDVWLDRPQGLLLIYRVWDWLSGGRNGSIHVMAIVFGVVLVVSTALVVWALVGQAAARWTAITCGVLSASPVLEGFIPNGELLSGALVAAGIAVWAVGRSRSHSLRWCFASGLLAGLALSVKQSGFDGLVAIVCCLAVTGVLVPGSLRVATRSLMALMAGVLSVLAVLMIHAGLTGWSRWWFAVAGYRSQSLSVFNNPAWDRLRETSHFGVRVLGLPLAFAAVTGLVYLFTKRRSLRSVGLSPVVPLILWLMAAGAAFLIGGGYWPHYWLLLCAPVSALAGVAFASVRKFGVPVAIVALLPCLSVFGWGLHAKLPMMEQRANASAAANEKVAGWFLSHRQPGDNLYVLCDAPAIYADAHQDPGVAYLWFPEYAIGPHAHERLIAYLTDQTSAPRFIAQVDTPTGCDPSGQVAGILNKTYAPATRIGPTLILERQP